MSCLLSNPKTTSCEAKAQIGGLRPTVWALNLTASDGTKLGYTETGSSELIYYNKQYIKQTTLGIGSNVSKVVDFKDGFFIPFVNFEAGGNIANISDAESSYTTSSSVSSYKIKNDNTSFCKLNIGFEADLYDNWEIKFSYDYYEEMTSENNRENQIQFTVVKKLMN